MQDKGINKENNKLKELVQLQNKLNERKAKHDDNFTTNIYREIKALNTSHERNVRTNSIINRTLHHKDIWDYATTAMGGLLLFLTVMLAIKLHLNKMKQTMDKENLEANRQVTINYQKSSSEFDKLEWVGHHDEKGISASSRPG